MITPEVSSPHNATRKGITLWVERGFNRRQVTERMTEAVPSLRIVSTVEQPLPGTESIDFPSAETPEGIAEFNRITQAHGIDAIWPQKSGHYDLSGINTEVHAAASPEAIALADDKVAFAEWLDDEKYRPFAAEVIGVNAIAALYQKRHNEGHEVIVKPVIGVAGEGYWYLSETSDTSLLNHPDRRVIHPDLYLKAMEIEEERDGPQRMIMMDHLPGEEVSVDLLGWRGEPLIHAVRTKLSGRRERIQSDHEVIDHVYDTARKLGFHGMVNFQYREDKEGQWKMLEVNPRPAGGTFYSEDTGFGIITNWAKLVAHEIEPSDVKQYHDDVMIVKTPGWRYETPENG